jgi:hypothetical protein
MNNPKAVKAEIGDRMIELRVKFWTDGIAEKHGEVIPKHAWDSGRVVMATNHAHGIKWGHKGGIFNSILDLPSVIAKILTDHGVTLHLNTKSRKLIQPIIDLERDENSRRK